MAARPRSPEQARQHAEGAVARYRRRSLVLGEVKLTAGCCDCGYNKHPHALQFDHRPGEEKVHEVSNMRGHGWPKVWAEIEKCDVVCANCHAIRTEARRHGTT